MKILRVVLKDQLSENISSLEGVEAHSDIILLCEAKEEYNHVQHHKKKIVFLISAMRYFALPLKEKGLKVIYIELEDKENSGAIEKEIARIAKLHNCQKAIITWPGDYRTLEKLKKLQKTINLEIKEDTRFLANNYQFQKWAGNKKSLRMEFFYRQMRSKLNILMADNQPLGGKWNFDSENRKFPREKLHS